jgi:acyl-CoA thioester hydrolase
MLSELNKNYPSMLSLPVLWGDMDAAQHVNNIIYLRYAESGRIDFLSKINLEIDSTGIKNPIGPILAETNIKYKTPLTFPDTVIVATRIKSGSIDEFGFWTEQIIYSQKLQRTSAEVFAKIVCYNYLTLKKAPIPAEIREKLIQLIG